MKAAYLAIALAICAQAQTVTYGPLVANLTHSTARIVWTTSASVSSAQIEWGRTTGYGSVKAATRTSSFPYTSTAILSGLTPGTTYYVRARLNNGAILSNAVSFTTLPEPANHPEPAILPEPVDISMPSGPYGDSSNLRIDSTCSNIGSVLTRLAGLTGSLNYEVVIPAGATCMGQFTFPARTNHTGWVIVRSDKANTAAFPPEGVRWTKNWAATLAKFITNSGPIKARGVYTSFPSDSACYYNGFSEGGYYHNSSLPPAFFPLLRCSDSYPPYDGSTSIDNISGVSGDVTITSAGHGLADGMMIDIPSGNGMVGGGRYLVHSVNATSFKIWPATVNGSGYTGDLSFTVLEEWRQAPYTSGTALPSSCTLDTWFWKTDTAEYFWCTAENQWTSIAQTNPSTETNVAAIVIPASAKKYRFIGVEVTGIDVPKPMPYGWDVRGTALNNQGMQLLLIDSAGSDIIWDRCYIHGHPKPARFHKGISLRGDRVAVIESYFEDFQEWRTGGYFQGDSSHAIAHYTGGPVLIRNNHLEAAGITYFAPNTPYDGFEQPHDVAVIRNTFRKRPEWRRTDTQTTIYPERHSWELKQGARHLLEGNLFHYKWSGINQGATTLASPRCSSPPPATAIASFANGVVTLASMKYVYVGDVVVISGTGSAHDGLWEVVEVLEPNRFVLKNPPAGSGTGGTLYRPAPGRRISDIVLRHNLYYQGTEVLRMAGTDPDCAAFRLPSTQRVVFENNLAVDFDIRSYAQGGRVDATGIYATNGDFGARSLYILNGESEDIVFRHNTVYGAKGSRPTFIVSSDAPGQAVEGVVLSDNVQTLNGSSFQGIRNDTGSLLGTAALNGMFRRDNVPFWEVNNNVICCGWSSASGSNPPTSRWPGNESEIRWSRPSLTEPFDFRLRHDSQFISGGSRPATDGVDAGVDVDLLESKMGRVKHTRVRAVSSASATISYLAPDAEACIVETGTAPVWGSGTRQADGGGDRVRNVSISGLNAGTKYHYRVLCAVEQPSGDFTTQSQ
jgi:hypothetical protein